MAKEISFLDKKYYSISEVSELCSVKPHTLRFWESEFKALKPITRKGKRRYYQKKDIEMIRRIQALLYKEGLTISGVKRNLNSTKEDSSVSDPSGKILEDLEKLLKVIN
jgi:DNA-binding transcriptional MerR regulator